MRCSHEPPQGVAAATLAASSPGMSPICNFARTPASTQSIRHNASCARARRGEASHPVPVGIATRQEVICQGVSKSSLGAESCRRGARRVVTYPFVLGAS